MTTLTMRLIRGGFVVIGPDVAPMKFKSRRDAREWCMAHHPGSPITEIGRATRPGHKGATERSEKKARGTLALVWEVPEQR
jgi:hypothetical protein